MGVPQGGIISPVLANLYLDKFDKIIEDLIAELEINNEGKKPYLTNPENAKLDNTIQNITKTEKRYKETLAGKI